jgi:membrane protein DedA with SNARE-associated domain
VDAIEGAFDTFGLAAVCLLMLGKAAGIPVPIPGDLIVLATAARAAEGKLILWQAFAALLLAVVSGATLQFSLARGPGRGVVYRLGRFAGLDSSRLDSFVEVVRRRGPASLLLALLTPGVRNITVPACGLADLPLRTFLPPLLLATGFDLILHFALGAVGGTLLTTLQPDPLAVASGLVVIAALGLGGWLVIQRRRSNASAGRAALAAWEATACPVCLALGALGAAVTATPSTLPEQAARV